MPGGQPRVFSDASEAAVAKRTRKVQSDGQNLWGDASTKIFHEWDTNETLVDTPKLQHIEK
jgi:hypothetical protein